MQEEFANNNQVSIIGTLEEPFRYNHSLYGEGFYLSKIRVPRLSEDTDLIPITVSERLFDVKGDYVGETVKIVGQFRSYNKHVENGRNRLLLSVFVQEIVILDPEDEEVTKQLNLATLDGFVCKPVVYRKTPLGREISDLLVAVNRSYGKSDYIPCICWGRNARYSEHFEVGQHIKVLGRIQSREYLKTISETETEKRVAYEVSISKLETVEGTPHRKPKEDEEEMTESKLDDVTLIGETAEESADEEEVVDEEVEDEVELEYEEEDTEEEEDYIDEEEEEEEADGEEE